MYYKFNGETNLDDYEALTAFEVHEHFKNGGRWSELTDKQRSLFDELWHPETYQYGVIRQFGWKFDMREFFNEYWVEIEHVGIRRIFAPCATCIREMAVAKNRVKRIALIRNAKLKQEEEEECKWQCEEPAQQNPTNLRTLIGNFIPKKA